MWQPISLEKLLHYLIFQNCPNADAYEALKDHFEEMVWLESTDQPSKNGQEIYQYDIVKVHSCEYLTDSFHVVKWCGESGYPAFDLDPPLEDDCNSLASVFQSGNYEIEIIGNIFQNPELLDF